ncbi:MAG: alpha-galactosidase [Planctomycetota bacterium]|jgi:hypothetical protein
MITINNKEFSIENDFLKRSLLFEDGSGLKTTSFFTKKTNLEYCKEAPASEFLITIDGTPLAGWKESKAHVLDGNITKNKLSLIFKDAKKFETINSEILKIHLEVPECKTTLTCCYEVYENLPGINKWLEVSTEKDEIKIEKILFEILNIFPGEVTDNIAFTSKDRSPKTKFFITDISEDIIQLHNPELEEGYFLCNDAPGPLKRFLVYPCWGDTAVCAGYNTDTAPFAKYIKKGENFTSNKSYLCLYSGTQDSSATRNSLRKYLRKTALHNYMKDDFMYCTWIPFMKNINENLVKELADNCENLGFSTLVIDDGWFTDPNWEVDKEKFPEGLAKVSQYVREKGLRFGLWFNIGNEYGNKGINTEDNTRDFTGSKDAGINGFFGENHNKCFASKHIDLMEEKLSQLREDYMVGYFKLDFSTIISPYGLTPIGCGSKDHKYHKDFADSSFEQYMGLKKMRDNLRIKYPDLIIDFSFETFGTDRPNISALQYSDLHHISNMHTNNEKTVCAREIRNSLYNMCSHLPVERILGSLICLHGKNTVENFLTSLIGAPLIAGDLRTLEQSQKEEIAKITTAIQPITNDNPLTEFIPLRGDKYITRKDWDGFIRLSENGNGILCLFRNESDVSEIGVKADMPVDGQYSLKNILTDQSAGPFTTDEIKEGVSIPLEETDNYLIYETIKN